MNIFTCIFFFISALVLNVSFGWEGINDGINPFFKNVTGPTPALVFCPDVFCNGKADGNYEVRNADATINRNYFLSCSKGEANCFACWPNTLEFSERCNQCLYSYNDTCITTKKWEPATTFFCPDICPDHGHNFSKNIEDPNQPRQYVACWKGITVGCIACPDTLMFNQTDNACLYEGKYWTKSGF